MKKRSPNVFDKILLPASLVLLSTVIFGCAGSSPRFSSGNNGTETGSARFTYDQTPEELNIEKSEAGAEDDHRVSINKMKSEIDRMERQPAANSAQSVRDRLLDVILAYIGTPYRIGGDSHAGMDCSGFSMVVFDSVFNMELPHNALMQSRLGNRVPKDDLRVGDLIFFRTVGRRISHVGIYLGDHLFAHASVTEGVTISSLQSTYYRRRYAGARQLIQTGISNGLQ